MTTTTISTEAVPQHHLAPRWRFVGTFVAGAALAAGIAVGVTAVKDEAKTPASPAQQSVHAQPSASSDAICRVPHRAPC